MSNIINKVIINYKGSNMNSASVKLKINGQGKAIYNGEPVLILNVIQTYKGVNEYLIAYNGEPLWVSGHDLTNIVWLID